MDNASSATTDPDEWWQHAKCLGMNAEFFYPSRGESLKAPIAVCKTCPVSEECLEWALDNGEKHGIWGGMSERRRRTIRSGRRRTAAAAARLRLAS